MRLFLVRHAESTTNINYTYGADSTSLTANGVIQARRTGKVLEKEVIDTIFCSNTKRTKQTLKQILKYVTKARVIFTDIIKERDLGIFKNKNKALLYKKQTREGREKYNFKPENGEDYYNVRKRAKEFIRELKQYEGKNVLVISHDIFIKMLILELLKLPMKQSELIQITNAGITLFELTSTFEVKTFELSRQEQLLTK